MPIKARVGNVVHTFPDGTTDDEIRSALEQEHPAVASPPADNIWNRFSQTVTTNSPLNPMNWPGMVKGAFESPFSQQNMQGAQHAADVFTGKTPPDPFTRGDIGEGLGHIANGVAMYGLGNEIGAEPPLPFPGFDQIGAVARGAAKGAYTGATDTVPVNFKRFGVGAKFSIPAPMAAAGLGVEAGGALGAPFGLAKPGAAIGGVVGGASPIIRGAIQGGKQALRKFAEGAGEAEASGIPAPPPVASPTPSPAPASAPVTPPPAPLASSAEQSLPGGRAVAGPPDVTPASAPSGAMRHTSRITDINRQLYKHAHDLDLPGSPAGQRGSEYVGQQARRIFGAGTSKLTEDQLYRLNEHLATHKTLDSMEAEASVPGDSVEQQLRDSVEAVNAAKAARNARLDVGNK